MELLQINIQKLKGENNMSKQEKKLTLPEESIRAVPCEIYSRVVGYYRPVQHWNIGKRQEFMERNTYDKSLFKNV